MKNIFSVGVGGVLGTLARYYIAGSMNEQYWFPVGTMAVNLTGSFLLAFFLTITLDYITSLPHFVTNPYIVLGISTGFMGSMTTFSALTVEFVTMIQRLPLIAILYLVSSFVLGFLSALAGRALAKQLLARLKQTANPAGGTENE